MNAYRRAVTVPVDPVAAAEAIGRAVGDVIKWNSEHGDLMIGLTLHFEPKPTPDGTPWIERESMTELAAEIEAMRPALFPA